MRDDKRLTLRNDTVASNPGLVAFQPLVWFKHQTKHVLILLGLLALSVLLTVVVSEYFFLLAGLIISVNAFYWIKSGEHFTADSNPGMVISTNPPLFAVYTDLSKGVGRYPVIKIREYHGKGDFGIGHQIATISVYSVSGDEVPHWTDFSPLPVEYATSDPASMERELMSYDQRDWDNLLKGLNTLRCPTEVGLYKLTDHGYNDWPKD